MLRTVQAGRGLAALAVAAYHLSILLGEPRYLGHEVLRNVTWRLDVSVDFFFVLSGFIIIYVHHKDVGNPRRLGNYLSKRLVRVFPVYWIYLATYCLLLALGVGTVTHLPERGIEYLSSLSLVRLLQFQPPLKPAWTLFHEVAFYGLFSILIFNRRLGLGVFAVWAAIILAVFRYASDDETTPFLTYFSAFNLDFFIGMGAFLLSRRVSRPVARGVLAAGLLLLVVVYRLDAGGARLLLVYAFAFGLILTGLVSWEAARSVPVRVPILGFLGDASYSVYLTHEGFQGLFTKIALRLDHLVPLGPYGIYALVLAGAMAGGSVVYLLVEKPLLAHFRSRATVVRQPVLRA